ncbi:MAG: hypothetical protein KKF56_03320 [Nanoarchaeota archaeon]|nr:hypothetical protein [Nanoarchaeota archaeon]
MEIQERDDNSVGREDPVKRALVLPTAVTLMYTAHHLVNELVPGYVLKVLEACGQACSKLS